MNKILFLVIILLLLNLAAEAEQTKGIRDKLWSTPIIINGKEYGKIYVGGVQEDAINIPITGKGREEIISILNKCKKYYCNKDIENLVNLATLDSKTYSEEELRRQFNNVSKIAMEYYDIKTEIDNKVKLIIEHDACAKVREKAEILYTDGDVWQTDFHSSYYLKRTPSGVKLFERVVRYLGIEKEGSTEYINVDDIASYTHHGILFLSMEDGSKEYLKRAEKEFKKALKLDRDNYQAYSSLGKIYYKLGKYKEAERNLEFALGLIELQQDDIFLLDKKYYVAMLHKYFGLCYHATMNLKMAENELRKSIELNPDASEPYHFLGFVYLDDRRIEDATRVFKKLLAKYPNDIHAKKALESIQHYLAGYKYMDEINFEKAIEEFKQALQGYKRFIPVRYEYALALNMIADEHSKNNEIDQAIKYRIDSLTIFPSNPDAYQIYSRLGTDYLSNGNDNKAVEMYEMSIKLKPDFYGSHFGLAAVLNNKRQYREVINELKKAMEYTEDESLKQIIKGQIITIQQRIKD